MEITYTKVGDYLLPNLILESSKPNINLGKYARLRLNYLKENKRALYTILLMENELANHLEEIQKTATDRIEIITKELAEKENITEELKANNQLKWVRINE